MRKITSAIWPNGALHCTNQAVLITKHMSFVIEGHDNSPYIHLSILRIRTTIIVRVASILPSNGTSYIPSIILKSHCIASSGLYISYVMR